MLLCLDVGNTHIYAALYDTDQVVMRFRYPSEAPCTADVLGVFICGVLREHQIERQQVRAVAWASVVPALDTVLQQVAQQYFSLTPFVLQAGVKTGLKITTAHPAEVGADLVAGAVAAVARYPKQAVMVVDFGTATTFTVINARAELMGAVFMPGPLTAMRALQQSTAKLPTVGLGRPSQVLGRNTQQSIQSGLYHMQVASVRAISEALQAECFSQQGLVCKLIATGGFADLYADSGVFDAIEPDLVLDGIALAYRKNQL